MAGEDQEEIQRAFWAIELVPGKEYSTTLPYDLHITQAVLPASAKDNGRSVVSITFAEEKEKTISIVSLKLNTTDCQSIDVELDEESEVTFTVSGKNPVHLSGYYSPSDDGPEGFYDDEEIDSDEVGDDGEMEDSEDDVDDDVDEETLKKVQGMIADNKRKAQLQNGSAPGAKKPKTEAPQQQKTEAPQQQKTTPSKPQQQEAKKPAQQQQQQKPQQKELPGGLKYTILKAGDGAVATKGKTVGVKYVGTLTKNGKKFDASTKPFSFQLGAQEVIKGWDMGVAGMKIGEKRQLIIPSELGYGARGAGRDIPPNSSLTFDVELVYVK